MDKAILYIHGKGGNPKEAEYYKALFEEYCYPAFYTAPNHAMFSQIKKGHSINYSDGFYIGLLYAVPLVLS